jgi:hypothetical protein
MLTHGASGTDLEVPEVAVDACYRVKLTVTVMRTATGTPFS